MVAAQWRSHQPQPLLLLLLEFQNPLLLGGLRRMAPGCQALRSLPRPQQQQQRRRRRQ
jgi:hypothetical protein